MKQLFTGGVGVTLATAGAMLAISGAQGWGLCLVGVLILGLFAVEQLGSTREHLMQGHPVEARTPRGQ